MTKKDAMKKARASREKKNPLALTGQQERFCQEYLIDRNGTRAAITAKYGVKSAASKASQLLTTIKIKRRVNQLISDQLARIEATADKIKRELTNLAFVNIADAYDQNGALKPFEDMPIELQRAILAVETEELFDGQGKNREQIGYTKRLKLIDKMKALELLGKHQKMFTDVTETHVHIDNLPNDFDEAEKRAGIPWPEQQQLPSSLQQNLN